jgi:hypothetical protein
MQDDCMIIRFYQFAKSFQNEEAFFLLYYSM